MKNSTKGFFLYLIVGAAASVSEWIFFFLLDKALHYTLAVIIAYVLSTFINWTAGRILVFKKNRKSLLKEIISIYIASIIGLVLNLIIMWIGVDLLTVNEMFTKISATGIVFIYNFMIRKLIIYK